MRDLKPWSLFLLALFVGGCSVVRRSGHSPRPLGNGEGVAGKYLASLDNSSISCHYKYLEPDYITECKIEVKDGEKVVSATGLMIGVSSNWPLPAHLAGAEPTSVTCETTSLTQTCRLRYDNVDESVLRFNAILAETESGRTETKSANVLVVQTAVIYTVVRGNFEDVYLSPNKTTTDVSGYVANGNGFWVSIRPWLSNECITMELHQCRKTSDPKIHWSSPGSADRKLI